MGYTKTTAAWNDIISEAAEDLAVEKKLDPLDEDVLKMLKSEVILSPHLHKQAQTKLHNYLEKFRNPAYS